MILQLLINKNTNQVDGWVSGNIAVSNPDCRVEIVEITEEEAAKLMGSRSELLWDGQKISFQLKEKYYKEETELKVLKDKFESGTQTQADIVEAIKRLL